VKLTGMKFVAIAALVLAALSTTIPAPADFSRIYGKAGRLDGCTEAICLLARADIGAYNEGVRENAVGDVLRGDAWGALAYLAGEEDEEVRGAFAGRIDAEVRSLSLSNSSPEHILLIAYEMGKELEAAPDDSALRAKYGEALAWLMAHPSQSVLYHSIMKDLARGKYEKYARPPPNARPSVKLAYSFEGFGTAGGLFLFPSGEQQALASQALDDLGSGEGPALLAEDADALLYYASARYPTYAIRPLVPVLMLIYLLPAALLSLIPAMTYATVRGSDRRSRFQRERAENIILSGAVLLLLIPLLANGLAAIPLAPYAALIVFFLPPIAAIYIYTVASLTLQREYGVIREMTAEVVVDRLRRSFWVFAFGALFTMLVVLLATNVQRYTAFLGAPLSNMAVPIFFTMLVLAFMPFVPRLLEMVTGSFEIADGKVKGKVDALCSKFGYGAESVRVIPRSGSTATNAFQAGLFGSNVRIFVFENLLDRRLFSEKELEAVVAHELAHVEKRHVLKTLIGYISAYLLFMLLFYVAALIFDSGSVVSLIIAQLAPYASFVLSLLVTLWIRRRFESEADARAGELGYGGALLTALKKIYRLNLMPAKRPKALSLFASHGDLRQRMRELYGRHA